ncbi:MAG: TIGR00289 family protein [Thermoplasmatota archaeon]
MSYGVLFSGGKDSALAFWEAKKMDIDVDYLLTVYPEKDDSYMFHKPNLHMIPKLARSIGIELKKVRTEGIKEKEVDDLNDYIKNSNLEGLVIGAVASSYQKNRIEKICFENGLDLYAPLWGLKQEKLIRKLIDEDFEVIIAAVAARGLSESWLGRKIDEECLQDLKYLNEKYCLNIAGEGGEFETFVLNAPFYRWGFEVSNYKKIWDGQRGFFEIERLKKINNKS